MCITALRAEVHACIAEVHIHTHALILPKSCEASTVPFDPVGLVPVGLAPVSKWHTPLPGKQYALLQSTRVVEAPSFETVARHCVTHVLFSLSAHLILRRPAKPRACQY